jgi:hypothetical protein
MTTRDVLISIVALAGLAAPAHASITYSSCNSGCSNSNTGVTFTTFGTTASGFGDTMSSPITFVSGGLSGTPAIYVDGGTLTEFDGFNGTTPNAVTVTGTTLAQTSGSGPGATSIQVKLPANTYAFAAFISVVSGGAGPYVELVNSASNFNSGNANYSLSTSAGTGTFFGVVSDTPISSLFIGNVFSNSGAAVVIQSFETGGPAAPASTPEVSTFLLIGSGLVLMRFLRRRQQRRRQTTRLDPVFS